MRQFTVVMGGIGEQKQDRGFESKIQGWKMSSYLHTGVLSYLGHTGIGFRSSGDSHFLATFCFSNTLLVVQERFLLSQNHFFFFKFCASQI
jgi:hypothetical protein